MTLSPIVMRGLDPAICNASTLIVIPATVGIQLHFAGTQSWTPTFVGVTSGARVMADGRDRTSAIWFPPSVAIFGPQQKCTRRGK